MTVLNGVEPIAVEAKPARDPWIKSVRASGSWLRSMRTRVSIREFDFVIDEPVAKGGENQAPTPMEFVAGAVNGCITVTIEAIATELGIQLDQVETLTRAHMDVRGFNGTADVSPHFKDYSLLVQVVTPDSELKLDELRRLVEKRCPAVNLLRDAHIQLDLQWQFSPEPFAPTSDDRYRS
jgi:uncharacterized OsmC-like protein